jgi:hypothetical protein
MFSATVFETSRRIEKKSVETVERLLPKNVSPDQGDQIVQRFTYWAIVYFGHLF